MRVLPYICCYLIVVPAFAIYDLASINITPSSQGTEFCFALDTSENEMYLALAVDEQEFLFLSPTSTGELNFVTWQLPAINPPIFFAGKVRPVCYGPFPTETLQNVQLYAGVGKDFDDVLEHQKYLQIFDGSPTLTREEKPWTVMVYIVGSSLERQIGDLTSSDPEKFKTITKGNASKDILEMLSGTQTPENHHINVVITTGGSSREGWKTVKRSLIRDGQLYVLEDLGKQLMSKPQTLTDFVAWATENFPAQHYALILWNHGGGTQGFGQDTSEQINAPMMSLIDLHRAYQTIREKLQKPLELVIYDACLMATIEVAEITATVADVMAGSTESEPSHGLNYEHLLETITENPPTDGLTFGKIAKDGYLQQSQAQKTFDTAQITYSVLDLTQLPSLRETLGQFAAELNMVFTDSGFLSTAMLSRGIIRAPGYPVKETGRLLRSLDEQKNIRIDFFNILQTVLPEFPQLKSYAETLQTQLQQLVVDYETNGKVKAINPEAGRLSLDIGSDKSYLSVLPEAYTQLNEALEYYSQKRQADTSTLHGEFVCPGGLICADAKWLNLKADEVVNIDGYYGQQTEQDVAVYLIKPLYRYRILAESLEIGVRGQEACQYQLCVSDTECSDLTMTESNGQRLVDVVYNEMPAVLTLCSDENANWSTCSVLPQQDGVWGREAPVTAGDTLTPKVLHLQDGKLTMQQSHALIVGNSVPVVKAVCDMPTAVITASYFGNNYKSQFARLCDKGDCVCKEDDKNESCLLTNFQFRAGVRIAVD